MQFNVRISGFFGVIVLGICASGAALPVARQNALVKQYCAVCHTDASRNGGLSLEHFDAANPDPGLATMLASKLRSNALGASGQPLPDRAVQDALLASLTAASVGADRWVVRAEKNAMTASIVRAPPVSNAGNLYRLTLTCSADTHEGEMQVAWSPDVPRSGQEMFAAADGKSSQTYRISGSEKMGNGSSVVSGPGSMVLSATPIASQTLTIRDVFPGETVVFPFGELSPAARDQLSSCFTNGGTH